MDHLKGLRASSVPTSTLKTNLCSPRSADLNQISDTFTGNKSREMGKRVETE